MNDTNAEYVAEKQPIVFYGWLVIGAGFVTLGITFGIWYSFSVFFLAIIKDFGWSIGLGSTIFSVFLLCHAMTGLLTGYLQDRFGPRVVIPIGAFILALSLIVTSQSGRLWHFYIAYGVFAGASISLLGFISHSAFLPNWFERKRGLAVGIAMSGIGFGMLFLVPLVEKSIATNGWRMTYFLLAGVVIFVVAPLNLIFARRRPEDLNLRPDGDSIRKNDRPARSSRVVKIINKDWVNIDWTLRRVSHTRRFWLLLAAFFCLSYAYQGTLLHAISAMVDAGLARDRAAHYFGILGLAGSGGKVLFGYLSDRFGRERANTLGGLTAAVGILCLIFSPLIIGPLPIFFALLFGLGYGAAAPLMPSISADIFSGRAFGLIFAVISVGSGAGGASGSFLSGVLRDIIGTYSIPLIICIVSLMLSCSFIWIASPRKVRQIGKITN
ncbi:MAG: MFS transporter [Desulfobacteraceae bacterium]|jgi:MFS family permease|nr:MAG: MFS transporter [Desulfobacteraceae bacterium]